MQDPSSGSGIIGMSCSSSSSCCCGRSSSSSGRGTPVGCRSVCRTVRDRRVPWEAVGCGIAAACGAPAGISFAGEPQLEVPAWGPWLAGAHGALGHSRCCLYGCFHCPAVEMPASETPCNMVCFNTGWAECWALQLPEQYKLEAHSAHGVQSHSCCCFFE